MLLLTNRSTWRTWVYVDHYGCSRSKIKCVSVSDMSVMWGCFNGLRCASSTRTGVWTSWWKSWRSWIERRRLTVFSSCRRRRCWTRGCSGRRVCQRLVRVGSWEGSRGRARYSLPAWHLVDGNHRFGYLTKLSVMAFFCINRHWTHASPLTW